MAQPNLFKAEKKLKGGLDSITSPSMKIQIQIMGEGELNFQKVVDAAQQCFAFTPQENFPSKNLNFHPR